MSIEQSPPTVLQRLKQRARQLKAETYALYLACRDPRTPWYARLVAALVVAYALSPVDLIPDFIPVIGYLDDLIIVPLGIALVLRLVPPEVMADSRDQARALMAQGKPTSRVGLGIIIGLWVLAAALAIGLIARALS